MNIISIDFSKKNTGVFLKLSGQEMLLSISNSKNDPIEKALEKIFMSLHSMVTDNNIKLGIMEGYAFNVKHMTSVAALGEVGGCIKMLFGMLKVPLVTVPVATWKMLTIGKIKKSGNEKRYLETAKKIYGKDFSDTDQADAYMIYKATQIILKKTGAMTPAMIEIKGKILEAWGKIKEKESV